MTVKLTPAQWLATAEFMGVKILDPDGWRGKGAPGWEEPLDHDEFERRLYMCTISLGVAS